MTTSFPERDNLSAWLNPKILEAYQDGSLQTSSWRSDPFPHAVFHDFFRPQILKNLQEIARKTETLTSSLNMGAARRANVSWGPFADKEVLRFLIGPDFRRILESLGGRKVNIRRNWCPQVARFLPGSEGFNIHNDMDEPRDAVMLINLTEAYEDHGGGEFCMHERHNSQFSCVKKVEPIANTVVFFHVSPSSWHNVADMNGSWTRTNILFDWEFQA